MILSWFGVRFADALVASIVLAFIVLDTICAFVCLHCVFCVFFFNTILQLLPFPLPSGFRLLGAYCFCVMFCFLSLSRLRGRSLSLLCLRCTSSRAFLHLIAVVLDCSNLHPFGFTLTRAIAL